MQKIYIFKNRLNCLFIVVWNVSLKVAFLHEIHSFMNIRGFTTILVQHFTWLKICNTNQIISKHSKRRQSKVSWIKNIHYCAIQRLEERLISWIWIILGSLDIQYFIKALHPKYLKPNKYEHELPEPSPAAWANQYHYTMKMKSVRQREITDTNIF